MNKKILTFVILLLLIIPSLSLPMPPHPKLLTKIYTGELRVPEYAFSTGKIKNLKTTFDKVTKLYKMSLEGKGITGTVYGVMLLVDFNDNPHQVEKSFFEDLANSIGLDWNSKYPGNTNDGSIKEYYSWISKGNINLIIDVYGWFRAPNDYSYYVNNLSGLGSYPRNAQKLVEDTVELADPYVDFSKYDNDGDGYIDMLLVVHAGPGAEFTGNDSDIWSHEWAISPKYVDGVYAKEYGMEPELWEKPYDMTIGVYCHEIGHIFELPDLYDIDYSSNGLGVWSLMAFGAWNGKNQLGGSPAGLDAWCKLQTGWYYAEVLSSQQDDKLIQPIMDNGNLIAIYKNKNTDLKEYFLIENRGLSGFDFHLPRSGLLIYHIDENKLNNKQEWYPSLDPSNHYMVALEQADGNFDLEKKNNKGDVYDTFPGGDNKNEFTPLTVPSSNYYQDYSGIVVKDIKEIGNNISIDLVFNSKPLEPFNPAPSNGATNVSINTILSWNCSDPDGDALRYDVYFGTDSNPPLVEDSSTSLVYNPGTLKYDTRYYWKIVAKDDKGGSTEGPIWSFITSLPLQGICITELEVPGHLIYKNQNTLRFQIIGDCNLANIEITSDSTVGYQFDETSGMLLINIDPLKGPTSLNINVNDAFGNSCSYSKVFNTFSVISQKSPVSNQILVTVVEYGFDEYPNPQMFKQRDGVYFKMLPQDEFIELFGEYLIQVTKDAKLFFLEVRDK